MSSLYKPAVVITMSHLRYNINVYIVLEFTASMFGSELTIPFVHHFIIIIRSKSVDFR